MAATWILQLVLVWGGWGLPDEALLEQISRLIRNDTRALPTGTDYRCTEVTFKGKSPELTMVVSENYFVRKTKRVAMTETRHVPLVGVQKVSILEDEAHPHWDRRFMVLIQYVAGGRSADRYGAVAGGDPQFGKVQAFTLGAYTLVQAQKIVAGLKALREALAESAK